MRRISIGLTAAALLAVPARAPGPVTEYYVTDGGSGSLHVVQGTGIVRSWSQRSAVLPIAVANTVRTYVEFPGDFGSEYDLAGSWTGVDYPYLGPPGQCLDGATDAVGRNWLAAYGDQAIWQFDLGWANPVRLFGGIAPTGVTYDQSTSHLWVIDYLTTSIIEYNLAGNALSSFSYGIAGDWLGCLAWEPATDTLWAAAFDTGELRQYDKSGALLQSLTIPSLGGYAWGGEFQITGAGCAPASAGNYGTGWPGTGGVPTIGSSGPPSFGASITISVSNSLGASTTGAFILGRSSASIGTPLEGTLLVIPSFIVVVPIPAAGLNVPGAVPTDPLYCGVSVYLQVLESDPGASQGVSFTNGLELTIGS